MRYFFRPQIALRNTDASGVLANSARQMNTDSSQAECNLSVEIGEICGRRQPLHPTLSQDVLCNILVQKLCGDFR